MTRHFFSKEYHNFKKSCLVAIKGLSFDPRVQKLPVSIENVTCLTFHGDVDAEGKELIREAFVDIGRKVKNLKTMKMYNCLTNFIVETFSGALNTLTELHLDFRYKSQHITPSNLKKLCAECVSLKTFSMIWERQLMMSEDLWKHVSKLKKLESLSLSSFGSNSIITPL